MSERIHIIMPVSRPENLHRIINSYLVDQEPHPFELRWHLMVQGPEKDPKGLLKVNEGISNVKEGYIWTPSDDSLQPRTLFKDFADAIRSHGLNEDPLAYVFSEERRGPCPWTGSDDWEGGKPGILIASPNNMAPCRVDATQVFFRYDAFEHDHFDWMGDSGIADGKLIERLYNKFPNSFAFFPEKFVWWGTLDKGGKDA